MNNPRIFSYFYRLKGGNIENHQLRCSKLLISHSDVIKRIVSSHLEPKAKRRSRNNGRIVQSTTSTSKECKGNNRVPIERRDSGDVQIIESESKQSDSQKDDIQVVEIVNLISGNEDEIPETHWKIASEFKCRYCGKKVSSQPSLTRHQGHCLTAQKSSFQTTSRDAGDGYKCSVCAATFHDEKMLIVHEQCSEKCREGAHFLCHFCPRRFVSVAELKRHAYENHASQIGTI